MVKLMVQLTVHLMVQLMVHLMVDDQMIIQLR